MRTRFWYFLWQHGPTFTLREWAWKRWLDKPAPHVPPRGRKIDQPSDETGVE